MYDGRVSGYDIHSRTIGTDYGRASREIKGNCDIIV
jgi:hypothetical protein